MAAIGGFYSIDGGGCDTGSLIEISRAMPQRGGLRREAYINGRGGLCFGAARGNTDGCSGLYTFIGNGGGNTVLTLDGSPCARAGDTWGIWSETAEEAADIALGAYLKYGTAMGEHFVGEFSAAIFDEGSRELLLLRDATGARPLYYTCGGEQLVFASEIKGIMRFAGGCSVDREILYEHVFSSCGKYSGGELYNGIFEVERGGGCVVSSLGVSRFRYRHTDVGNADRPERVVCEGFICPDEEGMRRLLFEVLIAFDHPQFDALMPSFIQDACYAREQGYGAVVDGTLCMDIGYSTDRRDRLCTAVGARVMSVPPEKNFYGERELKKMERVLKGLLTDEDRVTLRYIFGRDWEERVRKEKNTARRIRIEGMLCQTVFWYDNYNVILV